MRPDHPQRIFADGARGAEEDDAFFERSGGHDRTRASADVPPGAQKAIPAGPLRYSK
jgi:hypothetical protein